MTLSIKKYKYSFPRPGVGSFLLVGILSFIVWANFFNIDQLVRAQGQVIVKDRTQVIQVADGGVLRDLRVSEGEIVHKGQVLALLESERAHAGADEVQNRLAALSISKIRAEAEASEVQPNWGSFQKTHSHLVKTQRELYSQTRMAVLKEISALTEHYKLALEEYKVNERLFDSGDVSRVELMRARRMSIEAEQKINAIWDKYKTDARREIAKIQEEIVSQQSKLQERQSILDHTTLESPVDGIVKSLRVSTLGGVLRQGDELMQISPTNSQVLVEAKVSPADIGLIQIGQPVILKFDAFDYSIFGSWKGELTYISPDTLLEQGPDGRSNTFYRVQVSISDVQNKGSKVEHAHIKPGMMVSLDVLCSQRSVLFYIAKPIVKAFSGALGQR
ncbi:Type I secretion system membrane fusion protein PrsE [Curvibacter sp. AEP1-3]|uniref:HlyD family efflux transporter periplasmic adaptor subunit n=1 Tax=Curvibacter sp. AEP1-3 TaxID=1844971 RepID=UPI000B3CB757|nr:HlyD family efflux transporter periplasmic adaptor subunit [Curvibacter sp. AEP1-3]ARV18612.1 Type I secretion system membrane fusion protein PrsE [Curvibacter sp. AEP1-3]